MNSTVKTVLKGAGLLIGGYLVLVHFTGFKTDVGAVTTGGSTVIKNLQGR